MSARVYVLLDVVEGSAGQVAQAIARMPGVVLADRLEGRPDVMVLMEAPDRLSLAEMMMAVLGMVDDATEDLRILIARDQAVPRMVAAPRSRKPN